MKRYGIIFVFFLVTFLTFLLAVAGAQTVDPCTQAKMDQSSGLISQAQHDEICNHGKIPAKPVPKRRHRASPKKPEPKKDPPTNNNTHFITKEESTHFITKEEMEAFISEEGAFGKLKARVDHHHPDPDEPVVLTAAEFEEKQSSLIWTVVIILLVSLICLGSTAGIAYWLHKRLAANREADERLAQDFDYLLAILVQNGTIDQNKLQQ